ncbi:hypothetical protein [Tessaracoccus sp.]
MTPTPDVPETTENTVRFRPPPGTWALLLATGIAVAADSWYVTPPRAPETLLGLILVAAAFWISTFGIRLNPQSLQVIGIRRRTIPWTQIQTITTVTRYRELQVKLTLTNGTHVRLRAPSTILAGHRTTQYNRDLHTIQQYWHNHPETDQVEAPELLTGR